MPNTRVDLLDNVKMWIHDASGARAFWLYGSSGTGKSAVARSVCGILREVGRLGGSFFCSRGIRDDIKRIVPTLATCLARRDLQYCAALSTILEENPDVAHLEPEAQIKMLLEVPLSSAFGDVASELVFVIDAVDECSDGDATRNMLSAISACSSRMPIKFFITSRPEQRARTQLHSVQPGILQLHDIEEDIIEPDLRLYIVENLKRIRSKWEKADYAFPPEWPSEDDVTSLINSAGNLFIYAFTAIRYIGETTPLERLASLAQLGFIPERPSTKSLDDLYSFILNNAFNLGGSTKYAIREMNRVVAIFLALREPLSVSILSHVIDIPIQHTRRILECFHAVIYTPPQNDSGAVTTLHTSLKDYLTTDGRALKELKISTADGHRDLADVCIQTMASEALHFNVAGCYSSYLPTSEQNLTTISPVLRYSCTRWSEHVASASNISSLLPPLEDVLRRKMLFWIEVVVLVGRARLIQSLEGWATTVVSIASADLTSDLFVSCRDAIELSIPHIYISALQSLGPSSKMAEVFWPQFCNTPKLHVTEIDEGERNNVREEGSHHIAFSVTFSPDGSHIISGLDHGAIQIWSAQSGIAIRAPLQSHSPDRDVKCVSFSPDGARIASCSDDETICISDAKTAERVLEPLRGHTDAIWSVAFSPDGRRIASGSDDTTIRLWDAKTGDTLMEPLLGHIGSVWSVAFSTDGTRIVSGSEDLTIRIWDAETGQAIMDPLKGHTAAIWSVSFSPDGTCLVSGSEDTTIRIWDARTGEAIMSPLEGHTSAVLSVSYSPDATRIVSGSDDRTICIWDATTGDHVVEPLIGHSGSILSVAFSSDGTCVVSGSDDRTIRMWDV
ncbi:hypothetical protein CERSUDRAFT_144261, partial [Gelatoporia subvermispora B]